MAPVFASGSTRAKPWPVAGPGVSRVVDINPHRQARFMVGTGHPIVGPEALRGVWPTTVVVMNAVYRTEVADLFAGLDLRPELLAV